MSKIGIIGRLNITKTELEHCAKPLLWKELNRSASILWKEFSEAKKTSNKLDDYSGVFNSFLLLSGFALENLFKGIISDNPNIDKIARTHGLTGLALSANVKLDENEKFICLLLSDAMYNFGRYPAPLKEKDFKIKACIPEQVHETYTNLFRRCSKFL